MPLHPFCGAFRCLTVCHSNLLKEPQGCPSAAVAHNHCGSNGLVFIFRSAVCFKTVTGVFAVLCSL